MNQDQKQTAATDRTAHIEEIADRYRELLARDADCDEAKLKEAHSDLMPELALALKKVRTIEAARCRARGISPHTTIAPSNVQEPSSGESGGIVTILPDYELIRLIGRGGFGEVWLCSNPLDGEYYAAKLIPKFKKIELEGVREYRQRAENNPYLVPIWTVGETANCYYYIMPRADDATPFSGAWNPDLYVPNTLDRYIDDHYLGDNCPLAVHEVVAIGQRILSALVHLHEVGSIHCDVKPANVMRLKGAWCLGDHGLMMREQYLCADRGAPGFRPPEGVRDRTADLFAAGRTLFLALTGASLEEFPEFVRGSLDYPQDDPHVGHLREVILQACRSDPAERFQSARQMLRRIVQLQTSIVVLPFSALSSNPDDRSLGLGLAEDLIIALTKVDGLRVVDKISALSFCGKSSDLRGVAQELGASTVLDGTVQRSGSKLRVAVRLFDNVDESYLWTEQFDRKAEDVFEIRDEIVRSVVQRLKTSLVAETALPPVRRSPVRIDAYEDYSRGRYCLHKLTGERLGKAISHFQRAIQKDPGFAAAYAGLSACHCGLPYFGNVPPREAFSQAETYAHKALDLDPASAEAHLAMATVHMLGSWDWDSARRELERTIDLRPSFSNAFYWWAHYKAAMGRKGEAIAAARHAQELEPLSLPANAFLGFTLYSAHQFEEAEEVCRKSIDLEPEFFESHWILGKALLKMWKYEEALAEFEKARRLSADSAVSNAEMASTQAILGKQSEAEAIFETLRKRSSREYVPPTCFASISTALGRHDEAFKWLEQSYERRCCYLIYLKAQPAFEPLSSDPRFADLLQRLGLPS